MEDTVVHCWTTSEANWEFVIFSEGKQKDESTALHGNTPWKARLLFILWNFNKPTFKDNN